MWSPRTQNDRMRFAEEWRLMLEKTPNVDFWQDMVKEVILEGGRAAGVVTGMGIEFRSRAVILTNGTFLNGIIHIGEKQFGGGRTGEKAATGLTEQLIRLGFQSGRMKTGTPPRVDGRSLDYTRMEEQPGDENPGKFSFSDTTPLSRQRSCHITYTSPEVHDILREGFEQSPMFSGRITGTGPRYCPSIEDKINRFSDKERHQLFVEPEGWDTVEVYVNGFSTSLPQDVQYKALRSIVGFENVKMFRPGYAIEYDYFPPQQLKLTLETKQIDNLFFAGQINGTTGYEEAACQGLMAGINAHLHLSDKEPFVLKRSEAYIGVLIDDLVTKGTDEPYRMFTSRAEFRTLLRQDNADVRLTPAGYGLGLASEKRMRRVEEKVRHSEELVAFAKGHSVAPEQVNGHLANCETEPLSQKQKLSTLVLRPQISLSESLIAILPEFYARLDAINESLRQEVIEQVEIILKYEGYVEKESAFVEKMNKLESVFIKEDFDYSKLPSLSMEARQKLSRIRPSSLGQASRISGVSPADVSVLLIHLSR